MSDVLVIASRYETREKIGDYALFTLYRAWDTQSQQEVIVTLGNAVSAQHHLPAFHEAERQFIGFAHPHLVPLVHFGTHDSRRYLVMPALIGQPLENFLARKPQAFDNIHKWAKSLASVLTYLHNQQLMYQQLSPSTIWIDDQQNLFLLPVQVNVPYEPFATASIGALKYMSPEQVRGAKVTPASDQYALAVLLYEMLTGNMPHPFNTVAQYAMSIVNGVPEDAQTWRPEIPAATNAVLMRALSKQEQNRFHSITDFIEEFLHDLPVSVDTGKKGSVDKERFGGASGEESEPAPSEIMPEPKEALEATVDEEEIPDWLGERGGSAEVEVGESDDVVVEDTNKPEPPPPPTGSTVAPGASTPPKPIPRMNPPATETDTDTLHDRRSELLAQLLVQRLLQRQSPQSAVGVDEEIDKLEAEIAQLNQQIPERTPTLNEAEAQFTAYYARESVAGKPYGLYVYAHVPDALQQIARDVWAFSQLLGGTVPKPKQSEQSQRLKIGIQLTVAVEAEGLEFEPIALTKKWNVPFTRFDFTYTAPKELVGEIVNGRIALLVNGIEIAHIPFATLIEAPAKSMLQNETMPVNPLAAARFVASQTMRVYNKIFVSYSRKDKTVAENYRLAQMAVGHEVFMDSYSIRSGENWQSALAVAIDESDIFQLFWSENSAASENVRNEWNYALSYKCSDNQCVGFIRPVYWVQPMPTPPVELKHLNFRFVPFLT
jgi:serine/threonine protein kinase